VDITICCFFGTASTAPAWSDTVPIPAKIPPHATTSTMTKPAIIQRRSLRSLEDHAMSSFVQPGKWYLVADCSKCGEAIPLAKRRPLKDAKEVKFRTTRAMMTSRYLIGPVPDCLIKVLPVFPGSMTR
jgi:hypothetical protein